MPVFLNQRGKWLLKNKFPHLAVLDAAIAEDAKAYEWLKKHNYSFLIVFVNACNGDTKAYEWFAKNDLEIFIVLAKKIKAFKDGQTFDYHKLHF